MVPVVRDCDQLNFAGIEKAISDYGKRARDGKIQLPELQGGVFTISNGGIYGSMLSTPILNHPQAAIMGLHNIFKSPTSCNHGLTQHCGTSRSREWSNRYSTHHVSRPLLRSPDYRRQRSRYLLGESSSVH